MSTAGTGVTPTGSLPITRGTELLLGNSFQGRSSPSAHEERVRGFPLVEGVHVSPGRPAAPLLSFCHTLSPCLPTGPTLTGFTRTHSLPRRCPGGHALCPRWQHSRPGPPGPGKVQTAVCLLRPLHHRKAAGPAQMLRLRGRQMRLGSQNCSEAHRHQMRN